MRRPHKKINHLTEDRVYNSKKVSQFINYIMLDGKKITAEKIVYGAMDIIKEKEGGEPLKIFEEALRVKVERQLSLAMRWIIDSARSGKGSAMQERLAAELILASKGEGTAVTKKINTHKMADANKAFAHFAW